jgi:hypothetical protein
VPDDITPTPSTNAFGAAGLAAQVATIITPLPHDLYKARVLRRGDAHTIVLLIPDRFHTPVDVRVRTYPRRGRSLDTFRQHIYTKHWAHFSNRGPKAVWKAIARCCLK